MKKYIFRRVMISIATLLVIVLVLFLLMDLMPGTPFNDEKLSEAQIAMLYAKYGLDKPLLIRFFLYMKNMLTGDLGVSYAISGSLKPVANLTYIITPYNVGFIGDDLAAELENNGVII